MLKKTLFAIFLVACSYQVAMEDPDPTTPTPTPITTDVLDALVRSNEIWICHNPESREHGKLCTPQCYGDTKDNSKYCWILGPEDCDTIEFAWQRENCHFFD
jgi:hypothetical protein